MLVAIIVLVLPGERCKGAVLVKELGRIRAKRQPASEPQNTPAANGDQAAGVSKAAEAKTTPRANEKSHLRGNSQTTMLAVAMARTIPQTRTNSGA